MAVHKVDQDLAMARRFPQAKRPTGFAGRYASLTRQAVPRPNPLPPPFTTCCELSNARCYRASEHFVCRRTCRLVETLCLVNYRLPATYLRSCGLRGR